MHIEPGTRLGPYEIVSLLGAGGMGEVWRARDTRLDRVVAVKILPAALAQNAQFRLRFEREARTISQLTHPHICTVHDVGHEQGTDYLVMELLDGETLADRIARGALPLAEMLRYGVQIGEALDRAHRGGIVHRDLKPGNIMLTKSGAKLLDFGLARSTVTRPSPDTATEQMPLTAEGTIVGTFQYMAPEQLAGEEADARTDIFALGAVLYEMLTGRRAFQGKTKTSLIAAIVGGEPPRLSEVQPLTPPALEHVIARCLAKEPHDRWQGAHDVAEELRWIDESRSQGGAAAAAATGWRNRERALAALTALLLVGAAALGIALRRERNKPLRIQKASLVAPPAARFMLSNFSASALTVSPNGRYVTYAAAEASEPGSNPRYLYQYTTLWLQDLQSGETRKLAVGHSPFWSPDSRSIAFWSSGKLRRLDITGGPAVPLADGENGRGGTWNADGTIVFTPNWREPLYRVSGNGGKSVPVTKLDEAQGETTHRWPWFLPDGRHFLYLAGSHKTAANSDINAIYIGSLDSPERTLLLRAHSNVVYADGHLLFVRENQLMAQPFDPAARKLLGDPRAIAQNVTSVPGFFRSEFAASNDGTLVYFTGPAEGKRQLKWLSPGGEEIATLAELPFQQELRLSPDETHAAVTAGDPSDVWIVDLARGTPSRFTSDLMQEFAPVWSPDGAQLAFADDKEKDVVVAVKPLDGLTPKKVVCHQPVRDCVPMDWSPDGKQLLVSVQDEITESGNIWIVPLDGGKPYPFIATDFEEDNARYSPDGRWMVYLSDESGRSELYVVPLTDRGPKRQLTSTGVVAMGWLRSGREIRLVTTDFTQMRIAVDGDSFGLPEPIGKLRTQVINFDFARNGRILAIEEQPIDPPAISLVTNWPAVLK